MSDSQQGVCHQKLYRRQLSCSTHSDSVAVPETAGSLYCGSPGCACLLNTCPFQHWFVHQKLSLPRDRLKELTPQCLNEPQCPRMMWELKSGDRRCSLGPRGTVTTYASQTGWGGVWEGRSARSACPVLQGWNINLIEMEAVYLALRYFCQL